MGKVRYKTPSKNFEKHTALVSENILRASLGREQSVGEYHFISIENIIPYKKQSRKIFDQVEIEQLSKTIVEHGITNPLQVISSETQLGKFEVISGERRLRASIQAGLKKVPCIIIKETDNLEERALIENIQREDLHPIELGNSLASIMKNHKWGSISLFAEKIGKPQSTISLHLSYSKLPEEIKSYLIEHNIKSRDILRKLVICEDINKMKILLNMDKSFKINHIPKNVLRISIQNGIFKIQDKSLETLDKEEVKKLKEALKTIISKLETI